MTTATDGQPFMDAEMSAEEMRKALYDKLHNRGLINSLKSQVRNYMIAELSGKQLQKKPARHDNPTLQKRVLDSLVYQYLCDNGCDYTVGVFLPETETTQREILSLGELNQLLHISPVGGETHSILQSLIDKLMAKSNDQSEEATQTDTEPGGYLSQKLSDIDHEFSSRSKIASMPVEERMLAYQRKVEQTANQRADEEMKRWKQMEIAAIRMAEREKQEQEMRERRKQLEDEFHRKVAAVTERERSLAESVKVEFDSVQRETFQQRQLLIQQTEEIRRREADIREQKDSITKLQRQNEDKLNKLEAMLARKETELKERELHLDNTIKVHQQRAKMEEQLAYDSKMRELKAWESSVKDKELAVQRERKSLLTENERKELFEKRQLCKEQETQVNKCSLEVASLEMKVSGLHERLAKVYDYEILKESNISLKKNLEMTKERLDEMMKDKAILQERYEQLVLEGKDKAGMGEIMLIKGQMQRERDKALDDKVILEHRVKELDARLRDQLQKNDALVREFELQTDRQRYMNKEYGDLRKQMGLSIRSQGASPKKSKSRDVSFYDTSFHRTLPPELALGGDVDWTADLSSANEVSTATEESIVVETRKRLQYLENEAETLQSAFQSLTKSSPPYKPVQSSLRQQSSMRRGVSVMSASSAADLAMADMSRYTVPSDLRVITSSAVRSPSPVSATVVANSNMAVPTYVPQNTYSQADQFNEPTPNKDTVQSLKQDTIMESSSPQLEVSVSRDNQKKEQAVSVNSQWKEQPTSLKDQPKTHQSAGLDIQPEKQSSSLDTRLKEQPVSLDKQWKEQPVSLDHQWKDQSVPLDNQWKEQPVSLDNQWKEQPVSLDSQWKEQSVSLDSQWKEQPVSLDSQWKEQPAKQVPTTAPASSQLMAAQVSLDSQWKQESSRSIGQQSSQAAKVSEHEPADKQEPAADNKIDPVMQKYMAMVQQQRSQGSSQPKSQPEPEPADSISEHISLVKSDHNDKSDADISEDFW